MTYCITMEETRTVAVYFEAKDDAEAEKKAAEIHEKTEFKDPFFSGEIVHDWTLCEEGGRIVVDWD